MEVVTRLAAGNDADVIASAAAGDEMALRLLIASHHDDMRRVCRYITRDEAITDEAVQAAWAIAWRKLDRVRDPDRLKPWLVSIAVNEAKLLLRKRRRRAEFEVTATRSPKWRFSSMITATKFVLAGSVVALFGGLLVAGILPTPQADDGLPAAVTDSTAPDTTAGPLAGLSTEEVEPGVLRIISDDAGHYLDETHPTRPYDLDGITIQPDGTVWLRASFSGDDNEANPPGPLVWALGQPGVLGIAEGIPALGPHMLLAPSDGSLLVVGDRVVRLAGEAFVPDDGPMHRSMPSGTLWLIPASDLSELLPEGESAPGMHGILATISTGGEWLSPGELSRFTGTAGGANCWTVGDGVGCWDRGAETSFLEGTPINQIAAAPDGSLWAVGGYGSGGGGLYRISLD